MFLITPKTLHLEEFDIEIIARSLANQCRWVGHTATWFSVAEHSILVSNLMGGSIAGLLHDASDFVFGDIPGPIKHQFFDLFFAESILQFRIYNYFGVPISARRDVKEADLQARKIEKDQYVTRHNPDAWSPRFAEKEFLWRFDALKGT
jgi:hypothetical protein